MDLSKHTIVDGKRSPKLTNRTLLVWDVVDAARLWLLEFQDRPANTYTQWETQLAKAVVDLGNYDAKLIRVEQEQRALADARADNAREIRGGKEEAR